MESEQRAKRYLAGNGRWSCQWLSCCDI